MTDKVSDFFKDIKERFSSPFFSSFIIAWLIINWKVPVALFWYDQKDLQRDGYASFIDLIAKVSATKYFLWLPLLSAVLYTFAYPFLRNGILAFNAWMRTWGTELVIKVSKDSKIPMRAFLQLREKYYKQTSVLEEVIGQENNFQSKNAELQNQILSLQAEKNKYAADNSKWIQWNHIAAINGEWECTTALGNTSVSERFRFHNGMIRLYNNISGQGTYHEFRYNNFSYNPNTRKVSLDIQPQDGKYRWYYLLEDKTHDLTEMEGTVYKLSTMAEDGAYHFNSYTVYFRKFETPIIEDELELEVITDEEEG